MFQVINMSRMVITFLLSLLASSVLSQNYDYYDYSEENATINKCDCAATEVLDKGICLLDTRLIDEMATSKLFYVQNEFVCGTDSLLIELKPGTFTLHPNAQVYAVEMDEYFLPHSYCLESRFNSKNEIEKYIKICLTIPTMPICCSGDRTEIQHAAVVESVPKCENRSINSENKNLNVYIGKEFMVLDNIEYIESEIICPDDYDLISTTIGSSINGTFLSYGLEDLLLSWYNPGNFLDSFHSVHYCLDDSNSTNIVAHFCYLNVFRIHAEECEGQNCVRKCCQPNQLYNHIYGICEDSDELVPKWEPVFSNHENIETANDSETYKIIHGYPFCNSLYASQYNVSLLRTGYLEDPGHRDPIPPTDYCLDRLTDFDAQERDIALLCHEMNLEETESCYWSEMVTVVGTAVSCFFIVATLFVYLSVEDIIRRLSSKCVVSESVALLSSLLCLVILRLAKWKLSNYEKSSTCIIIGLIYYYSYLASFFWLNVMCIDMFFTIKSYLPVNPSESRKRIWFLKYSCYGWGCPLIFVIVVCVIDNLDFVTDFSHLIRPNILINCVIPINDYVANWTYVYGPVLVIIVVNLILFILVTVTLVRQKNDLAKVLQNKESSTRSGGSSKRNSGHAKESTILCAKLFLIMGITWIADIVSFAVDSNCYAELLTDLMNSLRGLFIFLIFVCKKDIIRKFKTTWRKKLGLKPNNSGGNKESIPLHKKKNAVNSPSYGDSTCSNDRNTTFTTMSFKSVSSSCSNPDP